MKKYIFKNKWWVLGYLSLALVTSGMAVYLSILIRDIVDVALSFELNEFWDLIFTSSLFFIAFGVIYYIKEMLYAIFNAKTIRKIREDVFAGMMKQEIAQFESVNSADYISALTNDIKLLEENFFLSLATVAEMGMMMVIAVGFMVYLNWIVAAALLGTLIILVIAQSLFGPLVKNRQTKLSESLSAFTVRIKDIFSGFEVIKSYQMKKHSEKVFAEYNSQVVNANFSLYHVSTIAGSVASVIGLFLQVGIVFFSAYLIVQGQMYPGTMVAMLILSGQITGPVEAFGAVIPMVTGSKEIVERLERFANVEVVNQGTEEATFEREIRVEQLAFTYPNQEEAALRGLDFTFEKNKKYALIGKSGCGKTTLAKVLIGHLNDYEGDVRYDGVKTRALASESFGKLPAMVHQNVYMFDEDIASNIGLHQSYAKGAMDLAVRDSGVDLFLNDERTLSFAVGENGSNLSGGQRQRIAVARALIQNKPLLILDEGTSAVDRQTGADIENRLLRRDDLTLITITHSLDAEMLKQYDTVIYMEEGEIVESGSFDGLVAQGGKFANYLSV